MHNTKVKLILFILLIFYQTKSIMGQEKIGIFDNHLDIGQCKNAGFANYLEKDQTYLIGGSGKNMWFTEDEFHYLWTTIQGDFILRAEFEFSGNGVDPHRKVGWVIKNDLDSNTPHVNATVHGDGLTSLQYRNAYNGDTEEHISEDNSPDIIQLERKGNQFIMSTAKFGEPLKAVNIANDAITNQAYVGLYVCSHNPDVVEMAKFRNVIITRPSDPDFQPYKDYIGSRLELLEVATGHRKTLFTTTNSIQAPNWTTDGEKLIYNSEGRLYNYHLAEGKITPLNTGFATHNNNDHVLSFDGKFIGVSDHNPKDNNQSTLYYLPVDGDSIPTLVTPEGAGNSYLHSWSPDRKKMVFTGFRKGQHDIYTVDLESGKEVQLTDKKTLDDGSEYSPDGKYIFFNSSRTGKMKLWRMDANGKNKKQLTFDGYNDWFPHISPDQKWIVFISFPKEIPASDHPFYQHCLIRLMPYDGGIPTIIGYIYGGQGSLNVPSWSPDSKFISFVSNSKF